MSLAAVVKVGSAIPPKTAAFSQHAHCLKDPKTNVTIDPFVTADSCTITPRSQLQFMGYSVRTNDWRYTEWVSWNGTTLQPKWDVVNATELYDHRIVPNTGTIDGDFDGWENANVAEQFRNVTAKLKLVLQKHFKPAPRQLTL